MATKKYVLPIQLSTFDSSSVGTSYQAINATGLPHSCETITIVNDSDADITVSLDGTTDHVAVIDGAVYNIITPEGMENAVRKGTIVYLKGTAGTGTIYLSGIYRAT